MAVEFQKILDAVMAEKSQHERVLSLSVTKDNWSILTNVMVAYNYVGWQQYDENEEVVYIEITDRIMLNGTPVGPVVKVKFSPLLGFFNIDEAIKDALSMSEDQYVMNQKPAFTLGRIMQLDDADKPNMSDVQCRIDELSAYLSGMMGFTHKKARKTATEAVNDYPHMHSLDDLLDKIMSEI